MLLIPVLTVYFFTVERSCVVAVAAPTAVPRGRHFLFAAIGSRASLKNRTSFCSRFLFSFFFSFVLFLMIKFSDISSAVPRVGQWRAGPSEGGAREPARAPEAGEGTEQEILPLQGREAGCWPRQGAFPLGLRGKRRKHGVPHPRASEFFSLYQSRAAVALATVYSNGSSWVVFPPLCM